MEVGISQAIPHREERVLGEELADACHQDGTTVLM
jgi:hypothetical protein